MVDSVRFIPKKPKSKEDAKSLKYLNYQEKRLFAIQRSSKPLFRSTFMQKIMEKMRIRFRWFYYFRIDPIYLFDDPDEQIYAIQQSTRTTFKRLQPLHEYFRRRSTWYYKWHIRPVSHKIHWAVLAVYTIGVIVTTTLLILAETPKKTEASYQFGPMSAVLVTGTEQTITSATAANSEGVNVGSWKGLLADDNYHWVIGSTETGYDLNITLGDTELHGANTMMIQTEFDEDATAPNTYVQICDWVSSTGVDSAADTYCTTGGWRTLNIRKAALAPTTATAYHFQIYNGYWGDGTNAYDTPLTNFVNGLSQAKIRFFSTTNTTTTVAIDYVRITANINPVYSPSKVTNLNANAGAVTAGSTSRQIQDIAKDAKFLYSCGIDNSLYLRIEKRYLSNGVLDTSFGTNGVISEDSTTLGGCENINIDSNYLYIVGANSSQDWRIEKRLLSDGTLAASFGTNGVLTDVAESLAIGGAKIDSNYLYIVGWDSNNHTRMEKRLLSDGSLVAGFGTNGVINGAVDSAWYYSLSIDSTYMYVSGLIGGNWQIEKRLLTDGSLVAGFGTNGVVTSPGIGTGLIEVVGSAIYAGGYNDDNLYVIQKFATSDGSLVTSFGSDGSVIENSVYQEVYDFKSDGTNLYVAGVDLSTDYRWRIDKILLSNGTFDAGFGTSGVVYSATTTSVATAMTVDPTYLYIGGYDDTSDWRFEKRKLSDGSYDIDSGFGLATGTIDNVKIGINGTTNTASDDVRFEMAGTASSVSDYYYSFNNVKTYTGMNTILVRSEYSCSTTGYNFRPKIYNFTTTSWEDLTTGNIACSATDANSAWAKNNVTMTDYISSGEIRVGFYTLANSSLSLRQDWIYITLGTTNSDDTKCEISMGTNSANTCTSTRDLDMTGTTNNWEIATEDLSNTMAHDFYPYDNANATSGEAGSSNIKFSVTQPADSAITGVYYATRARSGTGGTVIPSIYDYSGNFAGSGGFLDVGATQSATLTYSDNISYAGVNTGGPIGVIANPYAYLNTNTNEMWMRLRTYTAGSAATNSVNQWDFAMVSISWIEDSDNPTKTFGFTPTASNLVTGTASAILGATAAAAEGVNTGSWKGLLADDNDHWTFASTASGYDANVTLGNVALNGANKLTIQAEIDEDATAPNTVVQICDWTSATGVDNAADSACTTGGWRTLNLRQAVIAPTSATAYHWEIYNGYWSDGGNSFNTPLTNFVNGSNEIKIRYYSTTNTTSTVAIDYLRVFPVINPVYSPSKISNVNTNSHYIPDASSSQDLNEITISDNYIYAVGYDSTSYGPRIEKRNLANGVLDSKFGTSGVVASSGSGNGAYGMAIDVDSMYVTSANGSNLWTVEKRKLFDGSLVVSFGTNGVLTCGSSTLTPPKIDISSNYLYLFGKDSSANWRIEKRSSSDGAIDTSFGSSGVVTITNSATSFNDIHINGSYFYISGQVSGDWYIEKRALSDGSLDTGFGSGGVLTGASLSSIAYSLAADSTNLYIAGTDDNNDWRIEKRLLSDGSLVSGFGTSGVVTSADGQSLKSIDIDSEYIYMAGTDASNLRIEKRSLSNGELVNGFGSSGAITTTCSSCEWRSIVINSNLLFVGGITASSAWDWIFDQRKLSDGSYEDANGFGLVTGSVDNAKLGITGTSNIGSDNVYSGSAGTASSIADFYYSFNNVETYTGMNTILVRTESSCSASGPTYRPKIYNFTTASWSDLTTGSLACNTTDVVNEWAKNNITMTDYVSSGEIRVGFYGLSNSTAAIRNDFIYIMLGTTNSDTQDCEVTFGTNGSGDCTKTRDIDTTGTYNKWLISKEDESASFSHDYYPGDNDSDADLEAAAAVHLKFDVDAPTGTALAGLYYAFGYSAGVTYTSTISGQIRGNVYNASEQTSSLGSDSGFDIIGRNSSANDITNSIAYQDSMNGPYSGYSGVLPYATSLVNRDAGETWFRVRSSYSGLAGSGTTVPMIVDFVMASVQWIE